MANLVGECRQHLVRFIFLLLRETDVARASSICSAAKWETGKACGEQPGAEPSLAGFLRGASNWASTGLYFIKCSQPRQNLRRPLGVDPWIVTSGGAKSLQNGIRKSDGQWPQIQCNLSCRSGVLRSCSPSCDWVVPHWPLPVLCYSWDLESHVQSSRVSSKRPFQMISL